MKIYISCNEKSNYLKNMKKEEIEIVLKSNNPELAFEWLKNEEDLALLESFSLLIAKTVRKYYFEEMYNNNDQVAKGLDILRSLTPNLNSLDISGCEIEYLDVSQFTKLKYLNASYNNCLRSIDGLEKLENLEELYVRSTPSLVNLDVSNLEDLPNIAGLRTEYGMHFGGNISAYEEDWWDNLEYLFEELDLGHLFGSIGILTIDESDFEDGIISNFRWSGPKSIDITTCDKLAVWLGKNKLDIHFSKDSYIWPSDEEVTLALFTSDWTFITSFTKHRNDFDVECDECFEAFPFGEMVQMDPDDEFIRSCLDCSELREE